MKKLRGAWSWLTLHTSAVRYLAFFILTQIAIAYTSVHASRDELTTLLREVGKWGILATLVYKEITITIMALTYNKNHLDRAFIWHLQGVACLFGYGFALGQWGPFIQRHYYIFTVLWFQLWVQVLWSAVMVLYYIWTERLRPIYRLCKEEGWCGWKVCIRVMRGAPKAVIATTTMESFA